MNKKAYQAPACTAIELQTESGILELSGIQNSTGGPTNEPKDGDTEVGDDVELFSRGHSSWNSESWK